MKFFRKTKCGDLKVVKMHEKQSKNTLIAADLFPQRIKNHLCNNCASEISNYVRLNFQGGGREKRGNMESHL